MKAILIALSFSALSLAAAASEVTTFDDQPASMKTRAEVRAEVTAALARGERLSWGEARSRDMMPAQPGAKTRMQVIAEFIDARARGLLPPVGEG